MTLDQLIAGIRQVESGGNYHVVNSIGAVGAYQVMKANIPEWTRQALGYSMSWEQYRDSRSAQDAVARYKLGKYFNRYGAEGAASMWFSGQSNPNSRASDGGNTVRQYVDKVMGAAGSSSGATTYSGGGGGITATTPHLSDKELASQYGFTYAFLQSNPELKKLFQKTIANGWNVAQFNAHLQDTRWWKTHSQTEKEYLGKRATDPATAKQDLAQAQVHMRQLGNQLGIVESPFTRKKMDEAAYNIVAKGWDDGQARFYLGQYVYFGGDKHEGQGGQEWDALHQYAYSMGVKLSDQWYANNSRNIVRGVATEQDYKSQIQSKAKAAFPQYQKQIEGGQTVSDIAQPYLQSMSTILELPAGSVNLFDSTVKKALQYKNPTSGATEAKPLWQFENELRGDPRWNKTKNAQDGMMQAAHQVLSDFGLKF